MISRKALSAAIAAAALGLCLLAPGGAQAAFGINSFKTEATDENGLPELRAGAHPYEYTVSFNANLKTPEAPDGHIRSLFVELPPGIIGNPEATPRCPGSTFDGQGANCPANSQIGVAHIEVGELGLFTIPVFSLAPTPGTPFSAGFSLVNHNSFQEASLRTGGDYGATVADLTVPTDLPILSVSETIWGEPADHGHDEERGACLNGVGKCPTDVPRLPFLTMPTACGGPLITTVKVESLEEPGSLQQESAESLGFGGVPAGINSCESPGFEPTLSVKPETSAAESPTGLHVNLHIPQNEAPEGIATAHLKDTVVTLPTGLSLNASTADGLGACSAAQIDLKGPGPAQCPASSKVGTVKVETPLLDHPVPGAVYVARQVENPFGSLLAIYLVAEDPQTGVIVKLAGKVEADPVSGQLETTFKENPQLPFEDFDVDFFGGPRAALTTPTTCGTYTTAAELTPWSAPEGPMVSRQSSFPITSSSSGGPCAASEAQMPNSPGFEAGSTSPLAGAFSPFVTKLTRENGSQELQSLNVTLPPGVSAKLAGVQECSEAQIAQAKAREGLGEGSLERQSPSCPAASEIGSVNVGAGSGNPFYVTGHAYLAGPYKGAPLSLAIITPAVAGPFDLGTVVVRAALYIDETTAQGTVKSDPVPAIVHGIPIELRSVAVTVDRPDFTLNPTNCNPLAVSGEAISRLPSSAALSQHFQVGGCRGLDFSPKLALSLKGRTTRAGHPAFKAVLTQPSGQANIADAAVTLPPTEFIDPRHVSNPCTRPQFAEGACPPGSVLGSARAITPLLDKPLEGKVYFRANGGVRKLPDIVADLRGQVHIVLVGFVDSVHKKGTESSRTRTTFATAPDAPVSKFVIELKGGKKGTLVNSANLCKVPNIATVRMTAQNNKARDFNQRIKTSCKG